MCTSHSAWPEHELNKRHLLRAPLPPDDLDTHHHHSNPDAHCTDDVEFVVEDLLDGLRARLRAANQDPSHTQPLAPSSGHTSLPGHPLHTQSTGGPRERAGDRSSLVSWLVGGKENRDRKRRWVPKIWSRNQGRQWGKPLLWVYFLSGL